MEKIWEQMKTNVAQWVRTKNRANDEYIATLSPKVFFIETPETF